MMDGAFMSDKERAALAETLATTGSLAIHEHHPDLVNLRVGLHWDAMPGQLFDLDLSTVLLTADGQVTHDMNCIFYNNKISPCGSVRLSADDRSGARGQGGRDDEILKIDLGRVPQEITRLAFIASIYKAVERQQNFGLVRGAQVRFYNEDKKNDIIASFDLSEEVGIATAAVIGELQRVDGGPDWKYITVGAGDEGGLAPILRDFGVNI